MIVRSKAYAENDDYQNTRLFHGYATSPYYNSESVMSDDD